MPAGLLRPQGWEQLTKDFPNQQVVMAILGICQYGARIGYEGYRSSITIHPNLTTAERDSNIVMADITSEQLKNRLEYYPNLKSLPTWFTASPLGLKDKADGTKRRIYHLSYPPGDFTAINNGIPEEYGAIVYSTIENTIGAIQHFGMECMMVKRDFEAGFGHIPVSPLDTPLLGFQWSGRYYAERFLPFGLRTAVYLFNLFAEVFHWILENQLMNQNLPAKVIHYLDDFLIILPPGGKTETYANTFRTLCSDVGLTIKESKNEEGRVASFAGLELDSQAIVIRLPERKLVKA